MIYAVIPLSIRKDLDERLKKIDENFFVLMSQEFIFYRIKEPQSNWPRQSDLEMINRIRVLSCASQLITGMPKKDYGNG